MDCPPPQLPCAVPTGLCPTRPPEAWQRCASTSCWGRWSRRIWPLGWHGPTPPPSSSGQPDGGGAAWLWTSLPSMVMLTFCSGLPRPTVEPALPPHPPWAPFPPQPSSCTPRDPDHRVLSCCPSVLLPEPLWGQQSPPVGRTCSPSPQPPPLSLQRSATQPRWSPGPRGSSSLGGFCTAGTGPGVGSVANSDCCPILILPACCPVRGLPQAQRQSLLPEGIGGVGCEGISGQEPDSRFKTGSKSRGSVWGLDSNGTGQ